MDNKQTGPQQQTTEVMRLTTEDILRGELQSAMADQQQYEANVATYTELLEEARKNAHLARGRAGGIMRILAALEEQKKLGGKKK